MKNLTKTLLFTLVLCLITVLFTLYVQLKQQSAIHGCSYLDPATIDILALSVAIFLVIEGFIRIIEHPSCSLKRQLTRPIRIAIGFAIITIHILQFLHK